MAQKTLFDGSKTNGRVQVLFTITGATTETLDASALSDADSSLNQQLQIERIRWNSSSTVTGISIEYAAASTNFSVMKLVGSGHWYHDLAIKPTHYDAAYGDVDDENGDIAVTTTGSGETTVILDLRKLTGYAGRSDQSN